LYYTTDELLQDVAALESIVSPYFTQEIQFQVENALIRGTGVGQPLGILNSPALISVAAQAGQAAATIVSQNIVNMWTRMWAKSRPNAVWFYNQDIEPQLFLMSLVVGLGGVPTYLPANGLSGQPYGTLMGRPCIPIEYCSTLGTIGDLILADMGEMLVADKGGIATASSTHVQFLTDQTCFRFVYRIDAQPLWAAALTPFQGTNTLSPFVALATRP
jgi:HK97 family phage major capsid protein